MYRVSEMRRHFATGLYYVAVAITVALAGSHAGAQTPRVLRVVVPLPPGGAGDIVARELGTKSVAALEFPWSSSTVQAPGRSSARNGLRARHRTETRCC